MIVSKYTIREQNEAMILNAIIQQKEISRADLSSLTGLTKASVSAITKKLMDDSLIIEERVGNASTLGGRKPIMLTFNRHAGLVISMDIGYNYIEAMLAYIDGTLIKHFSKKQVLINKENVLENIQSIFKEFSKIKPDVPHDIVGMTIAIHGIVYENQITFTPYYDLDDYPLHEELQKIYPFPVTLYNEANLAALGEYTFSSLSKNLISISIHSGVGAGIVHDGLLEIGKHGQAGEIGHTILFPQGKLCPCGNRGCLEQYTSNKVIYNEFAALKKMESVNSNILTYYIQKRDPDALAIAKKNAELLSAGINNLIMLYDPDVIVINSSLYRSVPEMIDWIQEQLTSSFSKDVIIRNTFLQNRAILYGGLAVSAQNFLNIQELKLV
ncbi:MULTISPECIES: ROK family transcriptional regulator [unclassified Enterococcus]|jgi:predicted NBD/HSP70 family sugar kinase|uniref:ROK family transcriptional regulator n=1 Tax=unclassified Enterococcus TaxID=2608891 RepID=UPI000353D059|nr:ROK family protein [Enterococcus faecalis 13-SD-W-01]